MRLFDFLKKKKQNPLRETTEKMFNEIFPGGKKDIETGAKVLQHILSNKIDFKTAVQIYSRSASLAKISAQFDRERLKTHLAGYALHHFTEPELSSYYEFLTAIRNTPLPVTTTSSEDFYDKIFDTLIDEGDFIYPQLSSKPDEIKFIARNKENVVNESPEAEISFYVFQWLRYVSKRNQKLHSQITSLLSDHGQFSDNEKIFYINSVLTNNSVEQLKSDSNALNTIFIKLKAYRNAIDRLSKALISFYSEHEDKIDFYISKANADYPETYKVSRTGLTIQDFEHIFLRDVLSGKELK